MTLVYDGSFEGFLSVVFWCYEQKIDPEHIMPDSYYQHRLSEELIFVPTNSLRSERVWKGLQNKISEQLDQLPYLAFLSRQAGIEAHLLRFIRLAFSSPVPIESNFSNIDVLAVRKAARLVTREAMRVLQFVRFQKTLDNIYFSAIRPDYDVLFMVTKHFKERFTDQHWIVYDVKRDYGFFFNGTNIEEITISGKIFNQIDGTLPLDALQEEELHYQNLWKEYCRKITIRERLNLKVHKQHLPKRYWKFLTEKKL